MPPPLLVELGAAVLDRGLAPRSLAGEPGQERVGGRSLRANCLDARLERPELADFRRDDGVALLELLGKRQDARVSLLAHAAIIAAPLYDRAVSGRHRVFVTRAVPERVRAELELSFAVALHGALEPPTRAQLLDGARGASGLVTMLTDRVDEALFDAAGPQLRVIANYAVGVDNVDLAAAATRKVVVANTPDVLTEATAELTLALVLALLRRVAEGDRLLRRRERWQWAPTFLLGEGLRGKTLGIVGLGRIGRAVARLAEAYGMNVVATSRRAGVPLERLLADADVVSLHCPLTAETRRLIDAAALARMRPGAVLVNTARGPIVDEGALAAALAERRISGAALDVFEAEPAVRAELLGLENVVVTPHLGSATHAAREAMGMLCVEALRAVLVRGERPPNAV